MRAIWQKTTRPSIINIILKIIYLNFDSNLPGANELTNSLWLEHPWHCSYFWISAVVLLCESGNGLVHGEVANVPQALFVWELLVVQILPSLWCTDHTSARGIDKLYEEKCCFCTWYGHLHFLIYLYLKYITLFNFYPNNKSGYNQMDAGAIFGGVSFWDAAILRHFASSVNNAVDFKFTFK